MNKEQIKELLLTISFVVAILVFSGYTAYKADATITSLEEQLNNVRQENIYLKNYILDNDYNYTKDGTHD